MACSTFTYTCGHTGEADGRNRSEADQRARHFANTQCWDCQKRADLEVAKVRAAETALPELIGTPKQIAWAITLRDQHLLKFDKYSHEIKVGCSKMPAGAFLQITDALALMRAERIEARSAVWWIDSSLGSSAFLIDTMIERGLVAVSNKEWEKSKMAQSTKIMMSDVKLLSAINDLAAKLKLLMGEAKSRNITDVGAEALITEIERAQIAGHAARTETAILRAKEREAIVRDARLVARQKQLMETAAAENERAANVAQREAEAAAAARDREETRIKTMRSTLTTSARLTDRMPDKISILIIDTAYGRRVLVTTADQSFPAIMPILSQRTATSLPDHPRPPDTYYCGRPVPGASISPLTEGPTLYLRSQRGK